MLPKSARLSHVALAVHNLDACEKFYNLLGMQTELKIQSQLYSLDFNIKLRLKKLELTVLSLNPPEISSHMRL